MRDKWSLLVIISGTSVSQQVLDFGSPSWADAAYEKLSAELTPAIATVVKATVIKLY
jgi:hypothetical protein